MAPWQLIYSELDFTRVDHFLGLLDRTALPSQHITKDLNHIRKGHFDSPFLKRRTLTGGSPQSFIQQIGLLLCAKANKVEQKGGKILDFTEFIL